MLRPQHGGQFILRIEDTDASCARRRESEQKMLDALRWCWASSGTKARTSAARYGPYRQSERRRDLQEVRRRAGRQGPRLPLLLHARAPGGDARRAARRRQGDPAL
ncbi:MAG: glutamate--tRNA ligase family protein [Stutzerimonas stutzeri]